VVQSARGLQACTMALHTNCSVCKVFAKVFQLFLAGCITYGALLPLMDDNAKPYYRAVYFWAYNQGFPLALPWSCSLTTSFLVAL
jgi:hypothetical protein